MFLQPSDLEKTAWNTDGMDRSEKGIGVCGLSTLLHYLFLEKMSLIINQCVKGWQVGCCNS